MVCSVLHTSRKGQHWLYGTEIRRDWKPQISLEFSGPWFPHSSLPGHIEWSLGILRECVGVATATAGCWPYLYCPLSSGVHFSLLSFLLP